jgi:hypothetical protein
MSTRDRIIAALLTGFILICIYPLWGWLLA